MPARPVPRVLDVNGLRHLAHGEGLAVGQRLVDALLTRQRRGDLLADIVADARELGDRDELDAGIGHRVLGRIGRVGGEDRGFDRLAEGRGLDIGGVLIG